MRECSCASASGRSRARVAGVGGSWRTRRTILPGSRYRPGDSSGRSLCEPLHATLPAASGRVERPVGERGEGYHPYLDRERRAGEAFRPPDRAPTACLRQHRRCETGRTGACPCLVTVRVGEPAGYFRLSHCRAREPKSPTRQVAAGVPERRPVVPHRLASPVSGPAARQRSRVPTLRCGTAPSMRGRTVRRPRDPMTSWSCDLVVLRPRGPATSWSCDLLVLRPCPVPRGMGASPHSRRADPG